jgi:Glutamine synthetase, catalytic domain
VLAPLGLLEAEREVTVVLGSAEVRKLAQAQPEDAIDQRIREIEVVAGNRSACVRIPVYSKVPASKRIEFRPPDPSCNPYLAFAAMLMAGLEGIRSKTEPPAPIDSVPGSMGFRAPAPCRCVC